MNLNWFRRLFSTGAGTSSGRIIYCLPAPSVFAKKYNKDQFFKDMDWKDWNSVIDGFKKRFDDWYFKNMAGGHSSYLDFCALCALVEVFAHYDGDKNWHEPKNYKEFLRKLNPIFRKQLATPITVTRFEAGKWKDGKLKDYADVFYAGVRCCLHHHGDLAPFAGMSGTSQLATEHMKAGVSDCGKYSYSLVIFDPGKLKELLEKWLEEYCNHLKAHPNSREAKAFRERFHHDFGIKIPQ